MPPTSPPTNRHPSPIAALTSSCRPSRIVRAWSPSIARLLLVSPRRIDLSSYFPLDMLLPVGAFALNAYMMMIGPLDGRKKYRPWLRSALAIAHQLRRLGSRADFVILLAGMTPLDPSEEALILRVAKYEYCQVRKPGFHLGNYKLVAWQHEEYESIQLLDADVLPVVNMDPLFAMPGLAHADTVACPGRVAPLNAGWIAFVPSLKHYEGLTSLKFGEDWGHALDGWYNSDGTRMKPGWDFFDAEGNQGHLYSYFRFDAQSLAIFFHDGRYKQVSGSTLVDPSEDVMMLLRSHFPCPFSARRSANHAYIHYTGRHKPWTHFNPNNKRYLQWYRAYCSFRNTTDCLFDIFPDVDPAALRHLPLR